jgi:hypothetical protein
MIFPGSDALIRHPGRKKRRTPEAPRI